MSNLQFALLIASSISSYVLVIIAWMNSNARLSRLEATVDASSSKQDAGFAEVRAKLGSIDNHLMTFYTVTGKLEGRIDELSRR